MGGLRGHATCIDERSYFEVHESDRPMLIRATRQACFVMLRNGLTLEVFYADGLTRDRNGKPLDTAAQLDRASKGVWLMGESVLSEVRAGQA